MEKMQTLVGESHELHSNVTDYLKSLRTNLTILKPNPDEVYDRTTSVLQLIWLMLSSQKLADLPHP